MLTHIKDGVVYFIAIATKTVGVTGFTEDLPSEVVIPDSINGYPVTRIKEGAFRSCKVLQKILLPSRLVTIEKEAFEKCSNLRSVYATNLRNIEASAFLDCCSLEKFSFPRDLTSIDECAFYNCTALTSARFPINMRYLGSYSFSNCTSLEVVEFSSELYHFGDSVFSDCSGLKKVKMRCFENRLITPLFKTDNAPEVWFEGSQTDFCSIYITDIRQLGVTVNQDGYKVSTTIHCRDGVLIC